MPRRPKQPEPLMDRLARLEQLQAGSDQELAALQAEGGAPFLEARKSLGMTQLEMAKALDVNNQTLSKIEHGKQPGGIKLFRRLYQLLRGQEHKGRAKGSKSKPDA